MKKSKKAKQASLSQKKSKKKSIHKASKVTRNSFGRKTSGSRKMHKPSSGSTGSRVGKRKRIWFEDFYSEEITRQSEDFEVLCNRYGYAAHHDSLVREAENMNHEFKQRMAQGITNIPADRLDLSEEVIITIDGDDAKDFDDAVSLKKVEDNYELGVHIADVSHFIKPGSGLDQEAYRRATSVYLINEVLPMFPEAISNDLCSLVPDEIRFTYSCFLTINAKGQILDYSFSKSAIKSKRRCTYREVDAVLRKTGSLGELDAKLHLMNELKTILRKRRVESGSLNFVTSETYFDLGEEKVESVGLKYSLEAENLIEEFMLVTNICAAQAMSKYGAGIYRIHDEPKHEKLLAFERLVAEKDLELPHTGSVNPLKQPGKNRYQIFLESLTSNTLKENLSFLLLISMSQATYSDLNIGHYGLAFTHYTHFTSPIRRYPDLVVHRKIFEYLSQDQGKQISNQDAGDQPYNTKKIVRQVKGADKGKRQTLRKIAEWSSECERKAVDAEREYRKLKGMRYLEQNYEQTLNAVVMKVLDTGMYVKGIGTGIEGFVSEYDLSPDLYYDEIHEAYTRKREVVYALGTPLQVKLDRLNYRKLHIDFIPVEDRI